MEYHFPKRATICPIYACRKEFGIRAMAIDHFKSRHSKNSVFCEICNRPVSAKVHNTFLEHYKKLHPDVQPPEFLKNPIPKEDKVRKSVLISIRFRQNLRARQFVRPNPMFKFIEPANPTLCH